MDDQIHRYVDIDGIRTHYLEAGDPEKETVLLIHGGLATSCAEINYGPAIPYLEGDLHVIAVDVVGFGRTPCPSSEYHFMSAQGDFLVRFMETLDLVAHVGGNSLGGWLANYIAHEAPQRVKSLIVTNSLGAAAGPDDPYVVWDGDRREHHPPRRPFAISKWLFGGKPTREAIREKFEKNFANKALITDELLDLALEIALRNVETATERARSTGSTTDASRNNQMYRGKFMWEHARNLRLPVLMTWSRENPGTSPEGAMRYFNDIDDAQMHVFTKARHHVMIEHPEEWSRVVKGFIMARA